VTRRSSGSPGDKVLLQSGFLGGGGTGLLVREVRVGMEVGRVGGADDTTAPGTVWRHHASRPDHHFVSGDGADISCVTWNWPTLLACLGFDDAMQGAAESI